MPLHITKGSSNKGQSLIKSSKIDNIETKYPNLLIDKISILYDSPNPIAMLMDPEDALLSNIKFKPFTKKKGYKAAGILTVSEKRPVHIQVGPKSPKLPFIRLEFNPSKIGSDGFLELHKAIGKFLPNGYHDIIENGRISRLDIAVDFKVDNSRLAMDDLLFFPHNGAPFVTQYGAGGHLQTTMLGKGSGNQWKLYRKDKQQMVTMGRTIPPTIRIERVLRGQQIKLASIKNVTNVFAPTTFATNLPPSPTEKEKNQWALFADSVKVRGITCALLLITPARRTRYRKYLDQYPSPWWKPHEIWKDWKPHLSSLNIINQSAFE